MSRVRDISEIPDRLTEDEFWGVFGRLEHESLEFKREPPVKRQGVGASRGNFDVIPAMAMTNGGLIIIGVSDNPSELTGFQATQADLDAIVQSILHNYNLVISTKTIIVEKAEARIELLVIAVPHITDTTITTPDGRLLRRVAGTNQPLTGEAMERFIHERTSTSGESQNLGDFAPSDIDIDLLNEALQADARPLVASDEPRQIERALVDLGVALPSQPTGAQILLAGAILFAQPGFTQAKGFDRSLTVQVIRRQGNDPASGPFIERSEFAGPLHRKLENCMEFIAAHTPSTEIVTGLHRERHFQYPKKVLREVILNALAHRDYHLKGATIDITICDDKIIVRSPGSLPGHITLENIITEHFSRNAKIMRVLKSINLVEEYGDGMDMIFREMRSLGMKDPEIFPTAASVTVTLHNFSEFSVEEQVWLESFDHALVTPGERKILVMLNREGTIPLRVLKELLPDLDNLDKTLESSIAKGLIERNGNRGGSRYQLTQSLKHMIGSQGKEDYSRQGLLVGYIREHGSISTAEAADLLDVSIQTARKLLSGLSQTGILHPVGQTRARRYYLADA